MSKMTKYPTIITTMADTYGITNTFMQGVMNMGMAALNNRFAAERTSQDRKENFMYGEAAANSADARTRALYNDFYSPTALLRQYQEAGLSPSMMFGGTPGQGGMSGAQGNGSAGLQTAFIPASILEAAQVANLMAQTKKTKEETKNISQDTKLKEIETDFNEMAKNMYSVEFGLLTQIWSNTDGTETSLYEIAGNSYDYEDFLKKVREGSDEKSKMILATEAGQQTLRKIYINHNRFERDIAVLSNEEINANFQESITKELKNSNFASYNAKEAIQTLKANTAIAELTETQKDAWNNLLDRLGKNGSTTKDIIIVLGMILGQTFMKK